MPRLVIRPLALEKILVKYYNFRLDHQKGSHRILLNDNGRMVVIPLHDRELKEGTLHSILNQAGLTKEDIRKYK
jgi:predicted RNA binding protein YcfA (HicA-like mRNA interferase family)